MKKAKLKFARPPIGRPITSDLTEEDKEVREKEAIKDEKSKKEPGERLAALVENMAGEIVETEDGITDTEGNPILEDHEEQEEAYLRGVEKEFLKASSSVPIIKKVESVPSNPKNEIEKLVREELSATKEMAKEMVLHLVKQKKRGFSHAFTALINVIENIEKRLDKEGI